MPILLMINLKGGVGKTASTVAIAETLAEQGQRTLVIDADHQSMAGELLVGEQRMLGAEKNRSTLHDVFLAMLDEDFSDRNLSRYVLNPASNVLTATNNLSVLPCSFRIDDFFTSVSRSRRGHPSHSIVLQLLHKRMAKLDSWLREQFDFVIVDCPPSVAMQVKLFLRIADGFIVPSIPDQLSIRGSANLMARLRKYRYKLKGLGTLWTLYREQVALHREMVRCPYSGIPAPFNSLIPNATKLADAVDPRSVANPVASCDAKYGKDFAARYRQLVDELLCRCEEQGIDTCPRPVSRIAVTV
ncbi:MAG: AAA family ATPase [Pirellulaceae bacterium]